MKPDLALFVPAFAVVAALGVFATPGCAGEPPSHPIPVAGPAEFVGRIFTAEGELSPPVRLPKVARTDEAWREQLTAEQYRVVRTAGTERAYTGPLLENKEKGVYRCVACDLPLFDSDSKFKSGTGWPSFFRTIANENVGEHVDTTLGMTRTEIHCARCDGHLGHVFNDGPRPTGLRYCVNSVSIAFTHSRDIITLAEPVPMADDSKNGTELASVVFAGGCFWCVEAVFEELDGVQEAVSGYAGGDRETANYREVCSGKTGHAEVVKIVYDPAKISYEELLRVHFATHDPTQLNRQGNDLGTQYRSSIFFASAEEEAIARAFIADLTEQKVYDRPIVTKLEPLTEFFDAEPYHQNYVCQNPTQSYVQAVALPKVEKVRKQFKDSLKDESPLR